MRIQVLPVVANERGTLFMGIPFTDDAGVAVTPDSAVWSLTKTDGTVVNSREDVVISAPSSVEEVVLSGNDLAILDGGELETREFVVKWTWTRGAVVVPANSPVRFQVRNLAGVG